MDVAGTAPVRAGGTEGQSLRFLFPLLLLTTGPFPHFLPEDFSPKPLGSQQQYLLRAFQLHQDRGGVGIRMPQLPSPALDSVPSSAFPRVL